MTAIKFCGMTRVDDALAGARCGAHAIGLVFHKPSPRYVAPEHAQDIVRALPPFITSVGLFVDVEAEIVRTVIARTRIGVLQFHGDETPQYCRQFGLPYLKALRVRPGVDLLQYARDYGDAQGLLLDAYKEGVPGGTGTTFDWSLIPSSLPLPIVLSGGLTPENVTAAIRAVRPWAVDVSSGVEATKGVKDAAKMTAFVSGVRDADV